MVNNNRKLKLLVVWLTHYGNIQSHEHYNILPILSKLCDVSVFPLDGLDPKDSQLLDVVLATKPDVMCVRLYNNILQPQTIQYITSCTGVFTVGLFGDDEKCFYSGTTPTIKYAPCFDLACTTWVDAIDKYRDININPYLMSHGANAKFVKSIKCKKDIEVSFIGQMRAYRIKFLNNILNEGVTKMQVYGDHWLKDKGGITYDMYPKIISRTKVNLNISVDEIDGVKYNQVKARDFEIPMCGGFLLTGDNDDIGYYYDVGREIETYKTYEECADKIRFYVKNDNARNVIAARGHKRARNNYSYEKIYRNLLENIKINLPKQPPR